MATSMARPSGAASIVVLDTATFLRPSLRSRPPGLKRYCIHLGRRFRTELPHKGHLFKPAMVISTALPPRAALTRRAALHIASVALVVAPYLRSRPLGLKRFCIHLVPR